MEKSVKQMKKNNENVKRKKLFLQIILVISSLTILVLSLITLASTVRASNNLAFGKYRFYIMREDSHPDIAKVGDLVIAEKMDLGSINKGDKIVYRGNEYYFSSYVAEVTKSNIVNKIVIAEKDGISYRFNETEISGKVVKNIHNLGNIISFMRTPFGIFIFVLFIATLFMFLKILATDTKQQKNAKK